jgi:hypothetical protein
MLDKHGEAVREYVHVHSYGLGYDGVDGLG